MRAVQRWSGLAIAIMHQADWFESKMMLTFQLSFFSIWLKVQRQVKSLRRGKVSLTSSGAQHCPRALQLGTVLFHFKNLLSLFLLLEFGTVANILFTVYSRSRLMVDSLAVWSGNSSKSNLSTSKAMPLWLQAFFFFSFFCFALEHK